jgi:two-component system, LytTR family, sensor kinase
MKQKLLLYAVISSPIFALYAVSHPLIFGIVSLPKLMGPLSGLTLNIFIVWLLNIYITVRFQPYSPWKRAAMSYGILLLFQVFFGLVNRFFLFSEQMVPFKNFYLHPILTSVAINIVILIICNATDAYYKKNQAELKTKELELENSEAQRKLLVQQLQPHFLFNAMSVLKSLIQENPEAAEDYTVRLSEFLRYSVESQKNELVSLAKELQFANDYVELQKVRFEDSFSYVIQIPDVVLSKKVPVFALQTLVENVFKHNYFTHQKPLIIKVMYNEGSLIVSNNKVSVKLTEHTHTGLSNLHRRYELLAGRGIVVSDLDETFSVKIPLLD